MKNLWLIKNNSTENWITYWMELIFQISVIELVLIELLNQDIKVKTKVKMIKWLIVYLNKIFNLKKCF